MNRQFTATVYLIEKNNVLLVFHPKLHKWLPPGGHLELNELPSDGARREVREETGYEIEFISQENVWIERWNAKSFERPYMCLLEEIPAHKDQPAHQHMDLIYLAKPCSKNSLQDSVDIHEVKWFSLSEAQQLRPDEEIFVETLQVLQRILT